MYIFHNINLKMFSWCWCSFLSIKIHSVRNLWTISISLFRMRGNYTTSHHSPTYFDIWLDRCFYCFCFDLDFSLILIVPRYQIQTFFNVIDTYHILTNPERKQKWLFYHSCPLTRIQCPLDTVVCPISWSRTLSMNGLWCFQPSEILYKSLQNSWRYKNWLNCRTVDHLRDLRNQLAHFDQGTTLTQDKDHFQANIDVQQFRPEEISVRLLDDHTIKVEAKHEEQPDDHGLISRYATEIFTDKTLISRFKGILWGAICFPKTVTLQNWNPNYLQMEF